MIEKSKKIRLHKLVTNLVKIKNLEYTQAEIQRNIENYGVLVNQQMVFNRLEWVFDNQIIKLTSWPVRQNGDFDSVRIILDQEGLMIIYKPKNLVVQPGAGHKNNNLTIWLKENFEEQKLINSKTAGLVHRLDKNTQGLILVAKNQENFDFLQTQFKQRKVTKKYLTILNGVLENNFEIKGWQARDNKLIVRQKFFFSESEAKNYDSKFRFSQSIFRPKFICRELNLTLAEVTILTGRMHQIRLHSEALGFPVQFDQIYNQPVNKKNNLKVNYSLAYFKELKKIEFEILRKKIFQDLEYSLMSNYLKFRNLAGQMIEVEYKSLKNYL